MGVELGPTCVVYVWLLFGEGAYRGDMGTDLQQHERGPDNTFTMIDIR